MPYKKHNPVPESEMDMSRWQGHHSICQMLRDMYHETTDENIRLKCRTCMAMAKSMNKKLQYYKHIEEGIPPAKDEVREIQEDGDT